ncbi:MAG TPA: Clp protease N-terminal domain-containing protein [Solirubrobacteraceae bacterium]|nr:Clp protease N-terminal domain-containing protein [Solirubrobacteraceae bacterium]
MFERFSHEARHLVTTAESEARELGSPTIEAEHLLLACARLAPGTPVGSVLADEGLTHEDVREALEAERAHSLAAVGIDIGDFELPPAHTLTRPRMAANAKSALEHSLRIALSRGDKRIEPGHILLALLRAEAGTVPRALAEAGVDRLVLTDRVAAAF